MNKIIIAFLLLATPVVFSGCIFGKKTHSSAAKPARTDSSVAVAPRTAPPVSVPVKSDATPTNPGTSPADTVAVHTANPIAPHDSMADVAGKSNSLLASSLYLAPFNYTTFEGKAKMHYDGNGSSQDFTANFRIKKDSVIWVLVTAFGGMIPVARAYITPDSIKLVNLLQKEVTLMPISQANKLLPAPVDFSILQNFLTGQPLIGHGSVAHVADSSLNWILQISSNGFHQDLYYTKADSTLNKQHLKTTHNDGPDVAIQQQSFIREDGKPFPRARTAHIENNGMRYNLTMDFTSQSFNHALDFPFSYSSKYSVNPAK